MAKSARAAAAKTQSAMTARNLMKPFDDIGRSPSILDSLRQKMTVIHTGHLNHGTIQPVDLSTLGTSTFILGTCVEAGLSSQTETSIRLESGSKLHAPYASRQRITRIRPAFVAGLI